MSREELTNVVAYGLYFLDDYVYLSDTQFAELTELIVNWLEDRN